MTWLKTYNGIVEDTKFTIVARKAGCTRAEVLSCWLAILQRACANGCSDVSNFDFEEFDILFDLEDGTAERIFNAFIDKGMLVRDEHEQDYIYIRKWNDRQEVDKIEQKREYDRYRYQKLKSEKNISQNSTMEKSEKNISQFSTNEKKRSPYREEKRREEEIREEKNREEEIRQEETREEGEESMRGEGETFNAPDGAFVAVSGNQPVCPHKEIIALYNSILSELPQVKAWSDTRQKLLQTRWREDKTRQNLKWWEEYFALVKRSDFLTGKVQGNRQTPFVADLEWLIKPNNMAKVIEGKYNTRCSPQELDFNQLDDSYEATLERVAKEFPSLMGGIKDGA